MPHMVVHGNTPHRNEEYYRPQPHSTLAHKFNGVEVMLTITCWFALRIADVVLNFAPVGVKPKKRHPRLRPWDYRKLDLRWSYGSVCFFTSMGVSL
jgi:hypothetical protein